MKRQSKRKLVKATGKKTRAKIKHHYLSSNLYFSDHQTGKIKSLKRDKLIKAKLPGKRKSKTGKIYYEYRKNRSDIAGKRI